MKYSRLSRLRTQRYYGHPTNAGKSQPPGETHKANLFFSPFSVVRPTQIFGIFQNKKVLT